MKTASFSELLNITRRDDLEPISIARFNPRGIRGLASMRDLAPTKSMLKMKKDLYEEVFFGAILDVLDPQGMWDDLHRMTQGREPVLLCYEKPPLTTANWCHRSMVADWFARELGEEVQEFSAVLSAVSR